MTSVGAAKHSIQTPQENHNSSLVVLKTERPSYVASKSPPEPQQTQLFLGDEDSCDLSASVKRKYNEYSMAAGRNGPQSLR